MTTIVYKDGILATDSLITHKDQIFGYRDKIGETDECVYALCGTSSAAKEFGKMVKGEEFDKELFTNEYHKGFYGIVINKKTGEVSDYDNCLIPNQNPTFGNFIALGSGADIAKGAMLMGASAVEAIECAIKIDLYSGGKINAVKVFDCLIN